VKWRLVWFREKYPHGRILTEEMCVDLDQGYARFRATVEDGEGGKATGTGTELRKSFEDYVEKAETRSIGRALAALGIGTQFVGEELSEGGHVSDAPVAGPEVTGTPHTRPVEADGPAAPVLHPSADEVDRLFALAEAGHEPKDMLGRRLREIMGLSGDTRISKKFLAATMTPTQHQVAVAYYEQLLKRQVEEDVPDHGSGEVTHADDSAHAALAESAATPAGISPAGPAPGGSSSAPEDAAGEAARAKLRAEVATWALRMNPEEVEHILTHHPYDRTRALLWKARLSTNDAIVAD
jgi:hypothetical protein